MTTQNRELPHFQGILESLGVLFRKAKNDEAIADCPFCGKETHFSLNINSGLWQCWKCGAKGNLFGFLKTFYENALLYTTEHDLFELAKYRELPLSVFQKHRIAFDGEHYIFPMYNNFGQICNLRRYIIGKNVFGLENLPVYPYGLINLLGTNHTNEPIYQLEGEWDWLAGDWLLDITKSQGIAIGLPGAGIFKDHWKYYFQNHPIISCLDNDGPGRNGTEKSFKVLKDNIPSFKYVKWTNDYPSGYDVNNFVSAYAVNKQNPKECLAKLNNLVVNADFTAEGITISEANRLSQEVSDIEKTIKDVISIPELITEYSKVIDLNEDYIRIIKFCIAIVLSTKLSGRKNPIWAHLVGPAGFGKSEVICSFKEAKNLCHFESTLRRTTLVSGFNKGPDPSIIPLLNNKTLMCKDYTEVLDCNHQEQKDIYSTLRGGFDGSVDFEFGNGVKRHYNSRFSIIAGVTHNIRRFSNASVGERFLRYIMAVEKVDWRKQQEKALDTDLFCSKEQLYLLAFVKKFLAQDFDFSDEKVKQVLNPIYKNKLSYLAKLAANLRTTVDRHEYGLKYGEVAFEPLSEAGNRIYAQISKLAISLAILEGKSEIDEEIYQVAYKVAFDTVYSFQIKILEYMFRNPKCVTKKELGEQLEISLQSVGTHVEDLLVLGWIKKGIVLQIGPMKKETQTYKISEEIAELWSQI